MFHFVRLLISKVRIWQLLVVAAIALFFASIYLISTGVVYRELGFYYLEEGKNTKAIDWLECAKARNPKDDLNLWLLGIAYGKIYRWDKAKTAFEKAVILDPASSSLHYNLGVALMELGQFKDAILQYNEAIRVDPNFSDAYYNLGLCYVGLERYRDSVDSFRQAVSIAPKDADAQYNLGVAYSDAKLHDLALKQYDILRMLDKEYARKLYSIIREQESPLNNDEGNRYNNQRSLGMRPRG